MVSIMKEIRFFFKRNHCNFLEFWDCSSQDNWSLYKVVNKETKSFNLTPLFPFKSLWEFSQKEECDNLLNNWKMMFQASDDKERHFLDLFDDDLSIIKPTYSKEGLWLKYFGHSNSLYARTTRAIVNHSPIGEY